MLTKICVNCGKEFNVKDSHFERRLTCSKSCYYEYKSKTKTNSVDVACKHCGKIFTVAKSRSKFGRGVYCSKECKIEGQKVLFGARQDFVCLCCGKTFRILQSRLQHKAGGGKYCSVECRTKHRRGDSHPMFITGSASYRRGDNWQSQKRKAKQRDSFTCQKCGKSDSNDLHVHHIVPYRLFDDFIEANDLKNLITLCSSCHRKEDAAYRRLENETIHIAE